MRGKRTGNGAQAISFLKLFLPALGHPKPPASAPFHSSSIPSSWPLRQELTLSLHSKAASTSFPPFAPSTHHDPGSSASGLTGFHLS